MSDHNNSKNILVAPLNWGLGHATRCIPIINALEENGFTPIIASDGNALTLLRKEFPQLQTLELPSYEIEYPEDGSDFKWKMIKNAPRMFAAAREERRFVKKWVAELNLGGIISDNRLGVFSKKVPSVFITHQLNVLTGNTTWISTRLHSHIIKKYVECWVPDFEDSPNLSGKLGHMKNPHSGIRYIGPLSRFKKRELPKNYDLMVVLSGPEPQRTLLENKLKNEVLLLNKRVLFVRGVFDAPQKTQQVGLVTYWNFMTTPELETAFNESEMVLCRSGYTSLMDLAKLGKKCYLIPTPGQYEQEYLAQKLKTEGLVPFSSQDDFRIEKIGETELYSGIPEFTDSVHWKHLFCLFERE